MCVYVCRSDRHIQEKNEALQKLIGATRSYNLLAQSSLTMFRYLSSVVVEPFMAPELLDREAAMLNYFLVALAGPKCADLKVRACVCVCVCVCVCQCHPCLTHTRGRCATRRR